MAMRRIVQSLGGRTFKYMYASRTIGSHQQGPVQESKGGKASPHAQKDTYAPPQHRGAPHEDLHNWEQIKDDLSQGQSGTQQSQQPWMEKAKETLSHAADFVKEKTTTTNLSQTAEHLKEGAKEKLHQASEFIKDKTGTAEKDLGTAAKETFENLKEGAKDKLSQAQEFVRKQTIDTGKEKFEKYTPEQTKKITEEAWDFSKLEKGSGAAKDTQKDTHKLRSGVDNAASFFGEDQSIAGQAKPEQKYSYEKVGERGMMDSVKEKAANAAEWVKEKITPSGSEKSNLKSTSEKTSSASEKLKSDLKANEEEILKSGP